jgi:arsenate-mycothiol transferase
VNSLSAEVLGEIGVDIRGESPKATDPAVVETVDLVVVLGREARVAAGLLPGRRRRA